MKIGDRVAFSRGFLQSLQIHTGWRPFARGRVVSIPMEGFSDVKWDGVLSKVSMVNNKNLVLEDRIHLEAA